MDDAAAPMNVATAEAMMSPELAGLVSYQGPLRETRYPLHPLPSTLSTTSSSSHDTSSPLDTHATTSVFDPFADLRRREL